MSDIAPPRRPEPAKPSPKLIQPTPAQPKRPPHKKLSAHKVGLPPLHYGSVLAFSFRARAHPHALGLSALAATSLAAATGYGAWLLTHGGLPHLASTIIRGGTRTIAEAILLAMIYYIGRTIAQAAITYGAIREADQRPVSLSRQLGVGINAFGRRLRLDLSFGLLELIFIGLVGALLLTGGENWPINPQIQIAILFCAFIVILYLLTGLALARGLASVALVLTSKSPWQAAKLGWRLFSHRFELLALRFLAIAMELMLALPLAVLAVAFITATPNRWQLLVVPGVSLLAWLAGALSGAGTAAWWAALYRRLVLADRPDNAVSLLSTNQAQEARRAPLAFIVALTTLLVASALAIPWLNLGI
jgi:hypothetical protein